MASIDQIIRREINPFDPATFKPGNFGRSSKILLNVDSIHYEAIAKIVILDQVINHRTRTNTLRRLWFWQKPFTGSAQTNLNPKAFLPTLVLGLIATLFGGTSYAKPLIACYMFLKNDKNLSCCSGSGAYLPSENEVLRSGY